MKKTVTKILSIVAVITLIPVAASAWFGKKTEITFYHMFSKNSVAVPQSQILADAMNKKFKVDFRPGLSCSTKTQIDEDTKPAVVEFVTGRVWKSLQEKDGQCDIDLSKFRMLGTQSYYTNVCVATNSSIKTADDFINAKGLKAGYSTGSHMGFWLDNFKKEYGSDANKVQYPNSNKQVLALLAGEIDVATPLDSTAAKHAKAGNLRCISFGDPKHAQATEKLFSKVNAGLSSAPNLFVLAVKNVEEKDYQKLVKQVNEGKKKLDVKFPTNRFYAVGNGYSEADATKAFKSGTIDLYNLTSRM